MYSWGLFILFSVAAAIFFSLCLIWIKRKGKTEAWLSGITALLFISPAIVILFNIFKEGEHSPPISELILSVVYTGVISIGCSLLFEINKKRSLSEK